MLICYYAIVLYTVTHIMVHRGSIPVRLYTGSSKPQSTKAAICHPFPTEGAAMSLSARSSWLRHRE